MTMFHASISAQCLEVLVLTHGSSVTNVATAFRMLQHIEFNKPVLNFFSCKAWRVYYNDPVLMESLSLTKQ